MNRQRSVRPFQVLALTAATTLALPLGTASATPALHITSTVTVPGAPGTGDEGQPVVAEAPDGTVYATTTSGKTQHVYSVTKTGVVHDILTRTGGDPIGELAADATYLYVGAPDGIMSYRRTTGVAVHRWALTAKPRVLTQIAVAGNRVWALQIPVGYHRAPSTLIEINPASATRVRTVNGVYDTTSIATSSSAVYFVTNRDSTLVRLSNSGVRTAAKTHLVVNQTLSGPSAIEAEAVVGNAFIVRYDFGQGEDASSYVYNATSLKGPGTMLPSFLGNELAGTSIGTLQLAGQCNVAGDECVSHYSLTSGAIGEKLILRYDEVSAPVGPSAALLVTKGKTVKVLRIG